MQGIRIKQPVVRELECIRDLRVSGNMSSFSVLMPVCVCVCRCVSVCLTDCVSR